MRTIVQFLVLAIIMAFIPTVPAYAADQPDLVANYTGDTFGQVQVDGADISNPVFDPIDVYDNGDGFYTIRMYVDIPDGVMWKTNNSTGPYTVRLGGLKKQYGMVVGTEVPGMLAYDFVVPASALENTPRLYLPIYDNGEVVGHGWIYYRLKTMDCPVLVDGKWGDLFVGGAKNGYRFGFDSAGRLKLK